MKPFLSKSASNIEMSPPNRWKRQLWKLPWLLFYPLALLLKELASSNGAFIEKYYSGGIFPVISQVVGFIFGWIHLSVAELLLYFGLAGILAYIIFQIILFITKNNKMLRVFRFTVNLALVWCVGYFLFIGMWGLNYYRQPLAVSLGYQVEPRSVSDLTKLCTLLAKDANEYRALVLEDRNGAMKLAESKQDALLKIPGAYAALAKGLSRLHLWRSQPKPVLLSHYLSFTNITGIFIPFTMEPNVNIDVPEDTLLSAACHEAAHAQGFAREDEANFMSYLACMASGDPEMEYSGTLLALTTSMNALYSYDSDAYNLIARTYSSKIQTDLYYESVYWKQFEGPVADASGKVNNAYLKSNKQTEGVKSYGRMVDLLLARMLSEKQ
jgi:hypothetical protein